MPRRTTKSQRREYRVLQKSKRLSLNESIAAEPSQSQSQNPGSKSVNRLSGGTFASRSFVYESITGSTDLEARAERIRLAFLEAEKDEEKVESDCEECRIWTREEYKTDFEKLQTELQIRFDFRLAKEIQKGVPENPILNVCLRSQRSNGQSQSQNQSVYSEMLNNQNVS